MNATLSQLRRFLLHRHGLLGNRRFTGKEGIMQYIRQCGCIQFDPVDVCGKSHELALLARVENFSHTMLDQLLYEQRHLIDFFDKNLCIMQIEDWPCLEHIRRLYRQNSRSYEQVEAVREKVLQTVKERGHITAAELGLAGRADWYWSGSSLSRVALETLYFRGDLVIHHKHGNIKSYGLASEYLPDGLWDTPCPFANEQDRMCWQVLRRIGAVGALWNRPSDAWLGVDGMKAAQRNQVFERLLTDGLILPVEVEETGHTLFMKTEELDALKAAAQPRTEKKQVRLLAPLDCLLWDRRLIETIFDFFYRWEIYTPAEKRQYSYYVLPVLYGERFVGRIEPVLDRKKKTLVIRHFWPEKGFRHSKAFRHALEMELERMMLFHDAERILWE